MKVVDMFGAGLPVCAVDYDCITELVQPNSTGLLFKTPQQLADQLLSLLKGFTGNADQDKGGQLAGLRAGVAKEQCDWRWQDNWQAVAAPVFAHYAGAASGVAAAAAPPARKAKKVARGLFKLS
jgi:beta-1,4-mannosyltransferase